MRPSDEELRAGMVAEQIARRGVRDERVLEAMRSVPRHLFVPEHLRARAYDDQPLPIGSGQTISQPYIVAFMCERLSLTEASQVLEIGTGSGYQAAVLAELAGRVVTVEIVEVLFRRARRLLDQLGFINVKCIFADGSLGAPEYAPFDAVVVAASMTHCPSVLFDQLADGGTIIYPEGPPHGYQELVQITKLGKRLRRSELMGVRFVPMTGRLGRCRH